MRTRIALMVLIFAFSGSVHGAEAHDVSRQLGNDLFRAGEEVHLTGEVPGDVLLAGGRVVVNSTVNGDAVLAGGKVEVRGSVAEDMYLAGGEVEVDGEIGGSARVAGAKIEISERASIADGASIAGGEIEVEGRIGRYAQITGGEIDIDGTVEGDVLVSGGKLNVGPGAVIQGKLTFRGPVDAAVASGAQIAGGVENIRTESDGLGLKRVIGAFSIIWLIGWTIAGVVLLALFPAATRGVTQRIQERPGLALVLGLLVCFVTPALLIVLAITIIGIPLSLLLLMLYLLLLPLGYLASVAAVGDWLLPRIRGEKPISTGIRIATFIGVIIVVFLLTLIPFVGALVGFLLVLFGLGGLALAITRSGQRAAAA